MTNGPTALAEYLAARKLTPQTFAQKVRAHRSQIYRALKAGQAGGRRPGLDLATAIERETRGAVPVAAWSDEPVSGNRRRSSRN